MSLHLWTDLVDDGTVNTIPENGSCKSRGDSFLSKKNPFSYTQNRLILSDGCGFDIFDGNNWRQISNRGDIDFDPLSVLDQGSALIPGTDYFVYLCKLSDDPSSGMELVVSANATYPLNFNANNSRKIGGFHYGHIRCVDSSYTPIDSTGAKYGSGGMIWQNNVTVGVVPNSVWDLRNRPKTLFGGLVKVGNIWISIYPASVKSPITFMNGVSGLHVSGGELQSKYGLYPATGTEGLNQYGFNELAARAGMRLLTMREWLAAAVGNPEGEDTADTYGWTKTTNAGRARTGCKVNPSTGNYDESGGIKPAAISAFNCVDMVGNVWEWMGDYMPRNDSAASWAWYDVLGEGMGQAYLPNNVGLASPIMGGDWRHGVRCGPRAVGLNHSPWNVSASLGSRLACDAAA
jgi:formylglycine-generating enzyme required for sulfatase activity